MISGIKEDIWGKERFPGDSGDKKSMPAKQYTWVRSLGQEDALKKGLATHSSILAWRIPWTEEPGGLQSTRSQQSVGSPRVGYD